MEGFIHYLPKYIFAITVFNLFIVGCILLNYIVLCVSYGKFLSIKEYLYRADEFFFEIIGGLDGVLCGFATLFYVLASIAN